jgi:ATP-dependent RNA helicase DeaD
MPEPILKVVRKHIGDAEIIVDSAPDDEKPLIDQFCVIVRREDKLEALRRIIDSAAEFYGLIFCATKIETDELARRLIEAGYPAEAIHGDLSQEVRERTLRRFRLHRAVEGGEPAILVATDVAARGLDIEHLRHVINWDLPGDRETYVHRTGRTGRAGRRGIAISLTTLGERARVHQFSKMVEKNLGTGIMWLKVPSVKSVMKTLRRRITASVIAALPESEQVPAIGTVLKEGETLPAGDIGNEGTAASSAAVSEILSGETPEPPSAETVPLVPASPGLSKVCKSLIERLGAEKAVEALVLMTYGKLLDPDRYGPVTEFSEEDFKDTGKAGGHAGGRGRDRDERRRGRPFTEGRPAFGENRRASGPQHGFAGKRGRPDRESCRSGAEGFTRIYVGLGRQHGAGARDVANLLMKAGGIPGRQVDEIEMKDFCSFATLPAAAAQRACSDSRNRPQDPVIRIARPADHRK